MRWRLVKRFFFVLLLGGFLGACGARHPVSPSSFVGKWASSKIDKPIYLYGNGEWEIKRDDGRVWQYGIWDYRDGCIVWRHQEGSQISTEVNAVVSLTDTEFRLREAGQVTTFQRRH